MLSRVAAATLLTFALGGCAGLGFPFDPTGAGQMAANGNGGKAILASATVANDRVDPSDWEIVRLTLAGAPKGAANGLEWLNPDTGSTGTVNVADAVSKNNVTCRGFATTVNDIRGVRRYRGDICAAPGGRWQLSSIKPDDAAIS